MFSSVKKEDSVVCKSSDKYSSVYTAKKKNVFPNLLFHEHTVGIYIPSRL